MAEQDKDLPLVVAEILIEMHDLNSRMGNVENALTQVVDNIQQMNGTITHMAEVMQHQQEASNNNFRLLMDADQRNTAMLANALQQVATTIGHRLDRVEDRLDRIENK